MVPQRAGLDVFFQRQHRRLEAALVADAELYAGRLAGIDRPARAGGSQSERLFAEHVPARLGALNHLSLVQRVRRGQDHGVDVVTRKGLRQVGPDGQAHLRDCAMIGLRRLNDTGHPQIGVPGEAVCHVFAPPAKAGNRDGERLRCAQRRSPSVANFPLWKSSGAFSVR